MGLYEIQTELYLTPYVKITIFEIIMRLNLLYNSFRVTTDTVGTSSLRTISGVIMDIHKDAMRL